MNEVIVASAVRTAIGDFGGALKDVPPCDLGATVIKPRWNAPPSRATKSATSPSAT